MMMTNLSSTPIDLVYTWVDSSDPKWVAKREACFGQIKKSDEQRWSDRGEIKSSIASAKKFLPWLHHIYIITDDQQILEYDDDPLVTIVDHKTIFGVECSSHLPVFNSHAIEAHIHQIPGLVEHFICSCDDTFFGSPCNKGDFFGVNTQGQIVPKIFLAKHNVPIRTPKTLRSVESYLAAQMNSMYYVTIGTHKTVERRSILHQVKPLSKSLCVYGWKVCKGILLKTSTGKIRSNTDCNPVDLFSKLGLVKGRAIKGHEISNQYMSWKNDAQKNQVMLNNLILTRPKLYCINDIGQSNDPHIPRYLKESMPHCIDNMALGVNVHVNNNGTITKKRPMIKKKNQTKFKSVNPKLRRI